MSRWNKLYGTEKVEGSTGMSWLPCMLAISSPATVLPLDFEQNILMHRLSFTLSFCLSLFSRLSPVIFNATATQNTRPLKAWIGEDKMEHMEGNNYRTRRKCVRDGKDTKRKQGEYRWGEKERKKLTPPSPHPPLSFSSSLAFLYIVPFPLIVRNADLSSLVSVPTLFLS